MQSPARQNSLLGALSDKEFNRVEPLFSETKFSLDDRLGRPGEPVDFLFFPIAGMVSVVATMQDGSAVEFATIGRDGATGTSLVLGEDTQFHDHVCQVPLHGYQVAAALVLQMSPASELHHLLRRFAHAMYLEAAQSAACNRVHEVEERLARWLLVVSSKVDSTEFVMTHDYMAHMLGASRPTVTLVAGKFQEAGIIRYRRGHLHILKPDALMECACECYGAILRGYSGDQRLPRSST